MEKPFLLPPPPPRPPPALDKRSCPPLGRARPSFARRLAQERENAPSRTRAPASVFHREASLFLFALSLRVPHHLEKTAPSSTMLLVPSVSFFYMGAHDLRFVIDPCLEEEERSVGRCRRAKAFQDPSGGSRLKGEVAPPRRLRHHLLSHSNFFLFSPLPPFLLPPKKKTSRPTTPPRPTPLPTSGPL